MNVGLLEARRLASVVRDARKSVLMAVPVIVVPVVLRLPVVAVVAMGVWLALALAVSVPLVSVAARTIALRRENLAVVAQGR